MISVMNVTTYEIMKLADTNFVGYGYGSSLLLSKVDDNLHIIDLSYDRFTKSRTITLYKFKNLYKQCV